MNAKVELSVAAQLRAIANKLDGGAQGNTPAPTWEHGDAEFSPPDEFGRVQLRAVEMEIVPQYGAVIEAEEMTVTGSGVKINRFPIPRWFFIRESSTTDFAAWNVGNSAMREPANAAWTWKYAATGRVEADQIMAGTLATNEPLPVFLRKFRAQLAELAAGNVFTMYRIAHRDDPGA